MPKDPERGRHNRLQTYPGWLWEVFEAAKRGGSYQRDFPQTNYAVNARHRYHEFRRDCIREGYPGADLMTEMPCSYVPGSNKLSIMWQYIGDNSALERAAAEAIQHATQLPKSAPGVIQHSGVGDESAAEQAVMKYLRIDRSPSADNSGPDIPALDLSPQGPPLPACPPHELDPATETRCIKCGLPEPEWPK